MGSAGFFLLVSVPCRRFTKRDPLSYGEPQAFYRTENEDNAKAILELFNAPTYRPPVADPYRPDPYRFDMREAAGLSRAELMRLGKQVSEAEAGRDAAHGVTSGPDWGMADNPLCACLYAEAEGWEAEAVKADPVPAPAAPDARAPGTQADGFADIEGLPSYIGSILARDGLPKLDDDEYAKLGEFLKKWKWRTCFSAPGAWEKTQRKEETKARLQKIYDHNAALRQSPPPADPPAPESWQVPYDKDNSDYMALTEAIARIADSGIGLKAMGNRLTRGTASIHFMREKRHCRVHVGEFRKWWSTYPKEDAAERVFDELEKRKAEEHQKKASQHGAPGR